MIPSIAAGQRDKRITLEAPGLTPDGQGGFIEGWAPLAPPDMLAYINPASARDLERIAPGAVLATATHLITIPYHPGVTVKSRITYTPGNAAPRTFQITAVRNPEEANRELVIVAEELLA